MMDLSDEASLAAANEVEDVLYLLAHGNLLLHAGEEVVQLARALQDDLVGPVDVVDEVAVEPSATKPDGIQSAERSRLSGHEAEGQDILRETCPAAHHRIASHTAELMHQHIGTQDGMVVDDNLARQLCAVAYDTIVSDICIVGNMHAFHEKIAITYDGTSLGCRAPIDGDILAYLVVVTNLCRTLLASELEVLRNGTDDCTGEEYIPIADAGAIEHRHTIHQCVVVTYYDTFINITEWTYLAVLANYGIWVNVC